VSVVSGKMADRMAETVVLLHGFAGTRHGWDLVAERLDPERYRPLALDLRGHGDARDARPITFAACVADVAAAAPERFVLCGYSMGGRVALHLALAHPERVSRLVLVACSAGIEDPGLRAERRAADEQLAADAETGTIEAFVDLWMRRPLFAGTPPAAAARWREDLLRNDPVALAAVLRGIGAGVMEPLWDRLGELAGIPATIIAGERDGRYAAIGRRIAAALPGARMLVVPGAGHGLPREAPQAVAAAIATAE
jgi:2-succinyl-6-hydroxy-2,4-cyclohexadiene-1-carboxylate synthase